MDFPVAFAIDVCLTWKIITIFTRHVLELKHFYKVNLEMEEMPLQFALLLLKRKVATLEEEHLTLKGV